MKFKARFLALGLLVLTTTACIKVDTSSHSPTMGSELIDLSRAKEMGKLSEQEFKELRRKVLASF